MPGSQDGQADDGTRYFVRRPGGNVIGPFDKNAIQLMVQADKISEDAEISPDKENWTALAEVEDLVGASTDTQTSGRPSVNLPDSARGDDAGLPASKAEPETDRTDSASDTEDADLPTPKAEGETDEANPTPDAEDADLPAPKSERDTVEAEPASNIDDADIESAADADLPTPKAKSDDKGKSKADSDKQRTGGDADLPAPKSKDSTSDSDEKRRPDLSGLRNRLNLPKSKETGDEQETQQTDEKESGAGGGIDLPTPADASEESTEEEAEVSPSQTSERTPEADLPQSKKKKDSDLPTSKRSASGKSKEGSGPPDLPMSKESELPTSKESDLPTSKDSEDESDLPRSAGENLPESKGEDNLPGSQEELPTSKQGEDLPRAAEDNLPRDAQDAPEELSEEELFDAPPSEDDELFEEPSEQQRGEPDPFDEEDDLFSEPDSPTPGTPDDANESRALELGKDIGDADVEETQQGTGEIRRGESEHSPEQPPPKPEAGQAPSEQPAEEVGTAPDEPSTDQSQEEQRIRLDDDPEPFGDISDEDLSPVEDEEGSDTEAADEDDIFLDEDEEALFDSPDESADVQPETEKEVEPDDVEQDTGDGTGEDDPLRVEVPGSDDEVQKPEDENEYEEGDFITEPAGGDMPAGQPDPDPDEDDFQYGEVNIEEEADDSLELDASPNDSASMGGGAQPPPSQGASSPSPAQSADTTADATSVGQQTREPSGRKVEDREAADEGSSNITGLLGGILAVAILGAGGWYGYTMYIQDGPAEPTTKQTATTSKPTATKVTLSLEALGSDTFGDYRAVLDQAAQGTVEGDARGTLLLARALFLTRYEDKKVKVAGKKLATELSDASEGRLALGRGAWDASRGYPESAMGYLGAVTNADDKQLAYFAHLAAGIGEVLAAEGTPAETTKANDPSNSRPTTVGGSPDASTETDEGIAANAPDVGTKQAVHETTSEADAGTGTEKTVGVDAGETPPEQRVAEASEDRAKRSRGHLAKAANIKPKRAAPIYWRGRLAELRRAEKEAIDAYNTAIERQSNHVASHLQLARVLFRTGELKDASRHVSTILTELGSHAAPRETADAYHLDGEVALARSQLTSAIDSFKKSLNITTDRPETIQTLMRTYERSEQYQAALEFFSNPKTFDQKSAEVLLARARAHIGLEEWSNAIDVLETGEKEFPDDARFPYRLGELYMTKANPREARRSMRRAVKLNPKLLSARAALAHLAWITDKNATIADQHVSKILEHPEAIDAEVATQVAEYYRDRGLQHRAEEWLSEALERNPNYWPARLELSELHLEQENTDRALTMLEEAREDGVDDIRLSAHLADAYRQAGTFDRAIQSINQVIEEAPETSKWYVIRGQIHFDRGNWETAMSNFRRAKQLDPQNYRAIYFIGRTQYARKNYEQALETFRGILDYRSEEGEYHDWMARTFHQMGRRQKAKSHFERAIEVDQAYAGRHPDLHIRFAELLLRLNMTKKARDRVDTALEMAPTSVDANLVKADIYFEEENYAKAIEHYRDVLDMDESRAEAHYKLAMSYLYENERRNAATAFQKAIRHGYERPDVYEKLGYIYKELGRNDEAVEAFKSFIKKSDPSSLATETRREILNQIEDLGG